MVTSLELLSPAGNADIGIAAIDHGADAVYIGAPKYSARADAGVSVADIARLIRHAHLYYAKVYVALNTILTDNEIAESLDIIREIYQLGADALIIQDVGLLKLDLPPIPLIASTQMHNNTAEKVRFLEAVGFKRVILARELSLDEIADIRRQTGKIELEFFVHGALCVSYSGQCYLSQAVAARSGNRGVCAQPCRSHYTLIDGDGNVIQKNKFLLSLKDLNLMNKIPELIAAGVTSFKIEGRYKGLEYVKNVTAAYRQAIDRFINGHSDYRKSSSGVSALTFSPDPDRTFNRGYTQYFIGLGEKVASIDTQKAIGQYMGEITGVGKDYFRIARRDLQNGDGLCFFTKKNDLAGFRVDRVEKEKFYPNSMDGLSTGTRLYRHHDMALTRILKKSSGVRRIAVEMDFVQEDTLIRLTVRDEDGNKAGMAKDILFEPPRDPARAITQIETHLTSTGNTPYQVSRLTIQPQEPGFLPASLLNGIRRDVLEALTGRRREAYPRQNITFTPNDAPYPEKKLDFHANVFNGLARQFYEHHGAAVTEPAFEALSDTTGKTVMTTRYCIRHQLDLCPKAQCSDQKIKEPLRLRDAHHTYRLEFDCRECRMFLILEGR